MRIKLRKRQVANRVRWVRALLSGDYEQGVQYLKRENFALDRGLEWSIKYKYCCLGVACELVAPQAKELEVSFGTSSALIADRCASRKFGMSRTDQKTATKWNDSDGYRFVRIADLIAYATEKRIPFMDVPESVPEGYAAHWLEGK